MSVCWLLVPLHRVRSHLDAKFTMACFMKTIAPVDSMSGMIGKRSSFVSDVAFISNLRKPGKSATKGGNAFMYLSVRKNDRSTPFSTDEVAHQTKFAAVAASTRLRMQDPSKITQDQEGFREQTQYKTMYQYVFNLEWEAYVAG